MKVRARFAAAAIPEQVEKPEPRRGRLWTWIVAGGAVAALGIGIGFGVAANSDHNEYEDRTRTQARADELIDAVKTKAAVANAMFITSGVLAAGAAVLFFVEGRQMERPTSVQRFEVTPLLGSVQGLSVSTSF